MSEKKKNTNRPLLLTAVIGGLLILAMISANTVWSSRRSSKATNDAVSAVSSFYLEAMTDRRAKIITNLISTSFDAMEKAVSFIADENPGSQEELRNSIGKIRNLLGLSSFALVDGDDIVYTQYTTYTGRSRHPFLSEENIGERTISAVSLYGSSRQLCLVIPVRDLNLIGKPFKACFVQLDIRDIVNLLALDDHGKTYFALYSENGGNLSGTELGPEISDRNLFEAIREAVPEETWQQHRENFDSGTEGSLTINSGGTEETLCYAPIQGTGWKMATLIRESVIQDQIREISEDNLMTGRKQVIFTLVSALVLAAVLLIQSKRIDRNVLEEEKKASRTFRNMANTDSMTGVRNKHAYSETEKAINQKIRAGEAGDLAVVIGDINGLKIANDTLGHIAGDRLIRDACAMICEYFPHGAVFRVGGDEFAVILQGKGFDTMAEAIGGLNRKVEENIGEHGVVVAIGYSVLKPEDRQLRDVYERADQMMYGRKKQLVSMGAPSRRQGTEERK